MSDPLHNPAVLIRRVYSYAAYVTGHAFDAEDVTSEVFERALRYRESFDSTRGDPSAWLLGIARRVIADRSLRELPTDQIPEELVESHDTTSTSRMDITAAIAKLDERERHLIALRFGADLTAKEIGRVLELRPNTVEVALHRALARLRAELDDGGASHDALSYASAPVVPDTP